MTTFTQTSAHSGAAHAKPGAGILTRLRAAVETMAVWSRRAEQRRQIANLEHRDLADMGISEEQAAAEITKPFWRA